MKLHSPSDALPELPRRTDLWIRDGALLAWLIDPQEKAVTIYRPGRAPERPDTVSQVIGEVPMAGLVLPLDRIFT